jgi:hypothetical protein
MDAVAPVAPVLTRYTVLHSTQSLESAAVLSTKPIVFQRAVGKGTGVGVSCGRKVIVRQQ